MKKIALLLMVMLLCICLPACGMEMPEGQLQQVYGMWYMPYDAPKEGAPYLFKLEKGGVGMLDDETEITWQARAVKDTNDIQVNIKVDGKKQFLLIVREEDDGSRIASMTNTNEDWFYYYTPAEIAPETTLLSAVCNEWYARQSQDCCVDSFVVNTDGTCRINGETLYWSANASDDQERTLYVNVFDVTGQKYRLQFQRYENGVVRASVNQMDSWGGEFYSHPLLDVLFDASWCAFDKRNDFDDYFYISNWEAAVRTEDGEYTWTYQQQAAEEPLSVELMKDGAVSYVMSLSMEDEYPQLTLVNQQNQECITFYDSGIGYDKANPEAVYYKAMDALYSYMKGNSVYMEEEDRYLSGDEKNEYVYNKLAANGDYRDTQALLARFTIYRDVLTKVVQRNTDQLGNQSDSTKSTYTYDADGKLIAARGEGIIEAYGLYNTSEQKLEYDAAGKVSGISVGYSTVEAVGTPAYDTNGKLVSTNVQLKTSSYTANFTYDDQGRVTMLDIPIGQFSNPMTYSYTYDDTGLLTQKIKEWDDKYYTLTSAYTYENGVLKEVVETYKTRPGRTYDTTYTYTCDNQGRPVSAVITTTNPNAANYKLQELIYIYQDLYFFDSTGLLETE